jgi:hypothetical protein
VIRMGAVTSVTQQGKPLGEHASVDALGRSRILAHIIKRMVSRSFATFLLCGVYGEAVEQEDDNCFGVARSHGFAFPCAIRQPMENIALARSPSSRFFEQQVGRIINPALKLKPLYVRNSSGSFAIRGISQSENVDPFVSIRVSTAIAGTCGTAHRAHPLLICGGAVKHPRVAPVTGRL